MSSMLHFEAEVSGSLKINSWVILNTSNTQWGISQGHVLLVEQIQQKCKLKWNKTRYQIRRGDSGAFLRGMYSQTDFSGLNLICMWNQLQQKFSSSQLLEQTVKNPQQFFFFKFRPRKAHFWPNPKWPTCLRNKDPLTKKL